MGTYWSYATGPAAGTDAADVTGSPDPHGTKRPRGGEDETGSEDAEDSLLHTPRKKKLKTTTDYIYQVLFVDGENSDITINALGKEWKLHKLYLKQCGYFESMFNGSWREAQASSISIDIPDDNIDADALSIAFGCLYRDDLTIEPVQVISVLAAASLLQLEGLMQQCAIIMKETISTKTVCEYYECAVLYGLSTVETACFEWFENNIMCKQSRNLLKQISPTLMTQLIRSANLFVMQVEMDVYNLLKRWLFLQLVPSWNGSYKSGITKHADSHFKQVIKQEFGRGSHGTFLETVQGTKYRKVFSCLRFQHIIIDLTSTNLLFKDRIIPKDWLMPFFKVQWLTMLTVEQGDDLGPKTDDVDQQVFLDSSLRCARVLNKDMEYQWRWIGFNYGVDLVVTYSRKMLIFKRNCLNHTRLLANQAHRHIMFRVTISCLNDLGQVTYLKTSGIKSHAFDKNGELVGLSVDNKATFPLRIALNVQYYSPNADRNVGNLLDIPLTLSPSLSLTNKTVVAAIAPVTGGSSDNDMSDAAADSPDRGEQCSRSNNNFHSNDREGSQSPSHQPAHPPEEDELANQNHIHVDNPLA